LIVYHASDTVIEKPDIIHSRPFLDFGKGFYVTSQKEQAIAYSKRFLFRRKKAFVNSYQYNEKKTSSFYEKRFDSYDNEWLAFVLKCRKGSDTSTWDIVSGGIANDRVFRTLDLFFAGDISEKEALSRLKYEKPNHQLCFRNQKAIDELLVFIGAEEQV